MGGFSITARSSSARTSTCSPSWPASAASNGESKRLQQAADFRQQLQGEAQLGQVARPRRAERNPGKNAFEVADDAQRIGQRRRSPARSDSSAW